MSYNFVVLSSCGWGSMLQRPHHIARSLSKLGNTVHFIEPGALKENYNELNYNNSVKSSFNARRRRDNVFIYNSIAFYKEGQYLADNTSELIEELINSSRNETVIISYFPSHIHLINKLNGNFRLVYDCVDDHSDLRYSYWSSKSDIRDEIILINKADIVLTTSTALFLSKRDLRQNVYLSKNGVNLGDFESDLNIDIPVELLEIPKPRIAYVGAVYEWFDKELFYKTIDANPDKSFVVIGPVMGSMLSEERKNLYILGMKEHSELKDYLSNMDVGIIPFKDDIDLIINCNPIKMYEYLACGLPVVATTLPDLCVNERFIKTCSNFNEFNDALNIMVKYKPTNGELRGFLAENSWDKRAEDLVSILNGETVQAHDEIIQELRETWNKIIEEKPIIKSLYAQTFKNENRELYLKLAEEAFNSSKIQFNLKNYIRALLVNRRINDAASVLKDAPLVDDVQKAELYWAISSGIEELVHIKILYCIQSYNDIKDLINNLNDSELKEFEMINYLLEIGEINNIKAYRKLINSESIFKSSPQFNVNASDFLNYIGNIYQGQKHYFKSLVLTEKYLQSGNGYSKWKSYFIKQTSCHYCGKDDWKMLLERPDGNQIVSCNNCGLTRLEGLPEKSKIKEIYLKGFNNEPLVKVFDSNSIYEPDLSYISVPRLEWINRTLKRKGNCLLEIGCSNVEFLKDAVNFDWKGYGVIYCIPEHVESLNRGERVYNDDLLNIRFEADYFDCITLWDILEHFVDPIEQLQEMYRILRPGGKIYISTPNNLKGLMEGPNWFGYNTSYEHLYYFEPETLIKILTMVGFQIEQCFSHEIGDWSLNNITGIGHILLISARK